MAVCECGHFVANLWEMKTTFFPFGEESPQKESQFHYNTGRGNYFTYKICHPVPTTYRASYYTELELKITSNSA